MTTTKILFVCTGNICRSPTAEGVFNKVIADKGAAHRFVVDSAGTHAYHVGETPDLRAQATAKQRGIDLSTLRARKITQDDFADFDHILAMDTDHYHLMMADCPKKHQHKIALFLEYADQYSERDVPDPYYGGQHGFDHVFDLIEDAANGLYQAITK